MISIGSSARKQLDAMHSGWRLALFEPTIAQSEQETRI